MIFCYLIFQTLVVAFREILLWEILLQFSSTMLMLYMLYKAKGNPGHLRSGDSTHSITLSKRTIVAGRRASLPNGTTLYDHSSGQPRDEGNQIYDKDSVEISIPTDQSFLDASSVKWVDSRPIRGKKFLTCFFKLEAACISLKI